MRVLIAGGSGFLGRNLRYELLAAGHEVRVLTRRRRTEGQFIHWDARETGDWIDSLRDADAVVNTTGLGVEHWPWTAANKRRFVTSRVRPGHALASAITRIDRRPHVFVQFSGINRYGLHGPGVADERTPPAGDFMAQLTLPWEASTESLEALHIRRVIVRTAIVLHARHGLFPLMSLSCRLFLGGRFGSGTQILPWIHAVDHSRAVMHLLEQDTARGPYNLVAPAVSSNAQFMLATCRELRRPYWCHVPAPLMRLVLGEMADLVLAGRACEPRRLLESGFEFRFPGLADALHDVLTDTHDSIVG